MDSGLAKGLGWALCLPFLHGKYTVFSTFIFSLKKRGELYIGVPVVIAINHINVATLLLLQRQAEVPSVELCIFT